MSPLRFRATRRQMLRSLALGAASVGCAGAKDAEETTSPNLGNTAASSGGSASASNTSEGASEPQSGGSSTVDLSGASATEASTEGNAQPTEALPDPAPTEPREEPAAANGSATADTLEAEGELDLDADPADPETAVQQTRTVFDTVTLGNTGITTSRLAMGSGTTGYNGSSVQTRMGDGFTQMLVQGYERGIRFFETADAYGTHPFVGNALSQVGRQNVTLLTKTMAESAEEAAADLDRFLEELQTDYLDIVLLHIRTSATWTEESKGAMEVLAQAKADGKIRAHGVSCHSLEAMELAANTDWVDITLNRINPFQLHMDADPETIVNLLDGMKRQGKGVIGMKILAQGDAVDRFDEAIEHATRLQCIDAFTIGFRSIEELDQVAEKVASVAHPM